uniref:3-isopropylmalate dehydratase small subunit n=1 Tax=Melanthalia intermedia TaxID=172989 RepID=A0A345UAP3_9FLOR|nr:3-isopropylmalate dehydratase small subunit [Melanthalia intermedia]AXI97529.1 3-isopropylmalate dehydratase small subunit [Melanthalia intermedia]
MNEKVIEGKVYILGNDINTDQILTAEYMKINPATKEGYEELGSLAMSGLSENSLPFVNKSTKKSNYNIIVAGKNFGCGSSREHAPIALGSSGIKAVIAESFARIFFRNCISTGEILPVQVSQNLAKLLRTGDIVTIIPSKNEIILPNKIDAIHFNDLGDLIHIVSAGGLFNYARKINKIPNR